MEKDSPIFIAGHNGMVGSALHRRMQQQGYSNLMVRTRQEVDLANQQQVQDFFNIEKPQYVFLAAAKVGGIYANTTTPANFLYENLMIESNVIHAAYQVGVKKLLFMGSSCVYPKMAPRPLKEEYLLTGSLEETNEAYAIAKIAGIKLCDAYRYQYGCDFISVMPTNLYGPKDNYDLDTAHVLPALIRKFHEARLGNVPAVEIWGTGQPRREFLHVDDLAEACLLLMNDQNAPPLTNIGCGEDISVRELAQLIQCIVGYTGELYFDETRPDGTPQKRLDITKLQARGFRPKIDLESGIRQVYTDYAKETFPVL